MGRASEWAGRHRAVTVLLILTLVGLTGAGFIATRSSSTGALPGPSTSSASPAPVASETSPSPEPSPSPSAPAAASACRAEPLANVYHPSRLRVLDPCTTAVGVVRLVRHEADGDMHINVRLDPPYARMVNASNLARQDGDLVVEIVPADEPGCVVGQPPKAPSGTYDYGICTGANVLTPPVGARVRVIGPYVIDTVHGWAEIHPAWSITLLGVEPPAPASVLQIASLVPDPLQPGRSATLSAITSPGALCTITVRYPSGRPSTAKGLVQKNADSRGRVSWTWLVGATTRAGIGTAFVTCGALSEERSFTVA